MAEPEIAMPEDVWPLGIGLVATGIAHQNGIGVMVFAAVPDDLVEVAFETGSEDHLAEIMLGDGPKMALAFHNVEALDLAIASLSKIRAEMLHG